MLSKINLIVLLLFLFCSHAFADTEDTFKAGVRHYKNKEYQQAIKSFLAAQKQGLRTPALYHNLALSYFQLDNYKMAQRYFKLEGRYPSARMSSEYGLGLVAQARRQNKQALAHYQRVIDKSNDGKLASLAKMRVTQLTEQSAKAWSAYFQAEYGHDDNVNADPTGLATKQADDFYSLYASGRYQLTGSRRTGISINASAFKYDYSTINLYDMQVFSIGLDKTFITGRWNNSIGIKQQKVTLGSLDYQQISKLALSTQHSFTPNKDVRLRIRHDEINSQNTAYDYLEGSRQRVRLAYRYYPTDVSLKLYYQYEQNDRQDTATQSYSPVRNTLYAGYHYAITPLVNLKTSADYRLSDYPAKTVAAREDRRLRYHLGLGYAIFDTWELQGTYEYTDNSSSSAAYTYKRNLYSLSLSASF